MTTQSTIASTLTSLRRLAQELSLTVHSGLAHFDREVRGGYVSDLLSDVLAHSRPGDLWVTLQGHETAVAVASVCNLAGILLVGGRSPDPESLMWADREGVTLLTTDLPAYEVVGRLYAAGVPGRGEPR